ncbi:helix-turn-helix domain-containing protein [Schnuerera sp.]|uniref:helix-turn-helix domain-containing protein n=1 Tax=Schnuerera sp. TaxID=2794844 RepID=UPI002BAC9674|nr:helix-turn-helix domain-containing protein [Schnuerera sp.]HSH36461.1 helix-turn-helix domain-containing protein [Schnuerera sp.]
MLEIKEQHESGISIRQLAKDYSMSRTTIKKYLNADSPVYWPIRRTRGSKLDPYKELIIELLDKGKTQEEILGILNEQGYDGSRSLISSYISKNGLKKSINYDKNGIKEKDKRKLP